MEFQMESCRLFHINRFFPKNEKIKPRESSLAPKILTVKQMEPRQELKQGIFKPNQRRQQKALLTIEERAASCCPDILNVLLLVDTILADLALVLCDFQEL